MKLTSFKSSESVYVWKGRRQGYSKTHSLIAKKCSQARTEIVVLKVVQLLLMFIQHT